MTELVDPALAGWQAGDPAGVLQLAGPPSLPAIAPLISRHDIERDLSVAVVVMAGLVVRDLLANRGTEDEDLAEIARGSWRRHIPIWMELTVPAVQHAYVLGHVTGLTGEELTALATTYASEFGGYVNDSSAQAIQDGLQLQLNQRWSYRLARERAVVGYGLDAVAIRTYLKSIITSSDDSPQAVPEAGRHMVSKLLLRRAQRLGTEEAYNAEQGGQTMSWMLLYRQGRLPGAVREWELGSGEQHCATCTALAGQQVPPDEPFVIPAGEIWSPRAHPGCTCRVRLRTPVELSKADVKAAGICLLAKDTGRVLMLQRANDDDDPAGGTWEFPGGCLEEDEEPYDAAVREWQEEVRQRMPSDVHLTSGWIQGIYQGFVLITPSEDCVQPHKRGRVTNPDDPDGDGVEALAWWDPAHLKGNRAVRPELRAALGRVLDAVGGVSKAYEDDPFDRDQRGRFADHEGRRSRVQTMERPMDYELAGLIEQIRKPATLGSDRATLGSGRKLGATQSRLGTRAKLGAEAKPAAPATLSQLVEQKQAARQPVTIRIELKMPELKAPPETETPTRAGNFVLGSDVAGYYDENFDGAVGAWDHMVHFDDITEWYQENGSLDGDWSGGLIQAAHSPSLWHGSWTQVEGYSDEEWESFMGEASRIWGLARENAHEVVGALDDEELRQIAARAFRGDQHRADAIRSMILNSLDGDEELGPGLGDAYADFVAFARPDYLHVAAADEAQAMAWDRYLSTLPEWEYIEAAPPQMMRITRFAKGDSAEKVVGSYHIIDGTYVSALGERSRGRSTPTGQLNSMVMSLEGDTVE